MHFEVLTLKNWIKKSDIDTINGYFISNEQIRRELELLTENEWNMLCKETDKILRCCIKNFDGKPDEISKSVMKANLFNIGANNNVSAAAVWTAYLKWLDRKFAA